MFAVSLCLSLTALLWWTGVWLMHGIGIACAKYRLHTNSTPVLAPPSDAAPAVEQKLVVDNEKQLIPCEAERTSVAFGVTIIKPLCGMETNLPTNLETFFTLDYKAPYEILFCVHTADDPAVAVVRALIEKYAAASARLFIGGEEVGVNPKINNMMPAYRAARYPFVLISDAGIYMLPHSLTNMMSSMTITTGMVTQMPFICDGKGFAATLEKVFFGTMHARVYLSADALGVICSTGMSSLLRKEALDSVGGMAPFGVYLAEDFFFASAISRKGWRNAVATMPALQNHVSEVAKFNDRICRWGKLRYAMLPHTILLEPLQDCILCGSVGAWALSVLLSWNALIIFLVHVLVWMLLDYKLLSAVQGPMNGLPFSKFEYVTVWLWREMSAPYLCVRALTNQTIRWRTGDYRLAWGGKVQRVAR